jgi:hypothetical protein
MGSTGLGVGETVGVGCGVGRAAVGCGVAVANASVAVGSSSGRVAVGGAAGVSRTEHAPSSVSNRIAMPRMDKFFIPFSPLVEDGLVDSFYRKITARACARTDAPVDHGRI